jgi:hypothetical protein
MPVTRIPKPTIAASDAELEVKYLADEGWQTIEVEESGGDGLPSWWSSNTPSKTVTSGGPFVITPEGDADAFLVNVATGAAGLDITAADQPGVRFTFDFIDGLALRLGADIPFVVNATGALVIEDAISVDPIGAVQITAESISFSGDVPPTTRPALDLASPTLAADVAQALIDLGLCTEV